MDLEALISRYPRLYHMAEKDTWPSIKARGLLSTTAILDLFGVSGPERSILEEEHRPEKFPVGPAGSQIVLRDQRPMKPARLAEALVDGTTPRQWYRFLNGRVFMWAQEHRLLGLLHARHYRNLEHDVLTIDTRALMEQYHKRVWLCRMNSGNCFPVPHKRGMEDFKRIADYPPKANGSPQKEVVEVVVDYAIPDVANYVVEVRRMRGSAVLGPIPLNNEVP